MTIMWNQLTSKRRAKALSLSLFFLGLAILSFTGQWWPSVVLVIGIPLALRQFLLGRLHDFILTLLIFSGVFVTYQYEVDWQLLLPVLFVIAAVYVMFRDFVISSQPTYEEEEEDLNLEIEEHDP